MYKIGACRYTSTCQIYRLLYTFPMFITKSISIPHSTPNLEDGCFESCSSLKMIYFLKSSSIQESIVFGEVFLYCVKNLRVNFKNSDVITIRESCFEE